MQLRVQNETVGFGIWEKLSGELFVVGYGHFQTHQISKAIWVCTASYKDG